MIGKPEAGNIEDSFECEGCAATFLRDRGPLVVMNTFLLTENYQPVIKGSISGESVLELIVSMDEIDQFYCRNCGEPLYGYCE